MLVICRDSLPVRRQSPIQVPSLWRPDWESNSRPFDRKSSVLAVTQPSHESRNNARYYYPWARRRAVLGPCTCLYCGQSCTYGARRRLRRLQTDELVQPRTSETIRPTAVYTRTPDAPTGLGPSPPPPPPAVARSVVARPLTSCRRWWRHRQLSTFTVAGGPRVWNTPPEETSTSQSLSIIVFCQRLKSWLSMQMNHKSIFPTV